MNLRSILSALILLIALNTCAKGSEHANSLLWKLSGNGLTSPSYLFGTHHLVPISFLDDVKGLEDAFNSTDQVIGELEMGKMLSMQLKIMKKAILPKEYDYKTLLSKDDYELLSKEATNITGLKFDKLEKMRPAMINNLLMITLYQKHYPDLASDKGMDQYFQDRAKKEKKNIKGLESADEQIFALLEYQSIERQAEMLICMVKHPDLLKEQMDKLQNAYLNQDIKALANLYAEETIDDPCPSTDDEKYIMNGARNNKWLQLLPDMMKDKSSFIAVGCRHLVGDDGLIEGLRKAGYKVEAVEQ